MKLKKQEFGAADDPPHSPDFRDRLYQKYPQSPGAPEASWTPHSCSYYSLLSEIVAVFKTRYESMPHRASGVMKPHGCYSKYY